MKNNLSDKDRARKTLYVTGFNPKRITKQLLEELFTQGGPVRNITLFDTHAYVLFQHEESVPYCLALFNEVELHGCKLRLNPRIKSKDAFHYLRYLSAVRTKLMAENRKIPPPDLPPKKIPSRKHELTSSKHQSKKRTERSHKKCSTKLDKQSSEKSKHKPSTNSKNQPPKKSNNHPPRRPNDRQPSGKSNRQPTKKSSKPKSSRKTIKRPNHNQSKRTKSMKGESRKR